MPATVRWNMEAEQALLGAILINNDAFGAAMKHVRATDFFEPLHARIYEEAGRLITSGRKATPITLKDAFPNIKLTDEPGALTVPQYLARLCAEATTIINAPDYAQTIRDLAMMRAIIAIAGDLERAPSDGYNSDEALKQAFSQLDELRAGNSRSEEERSSIGRLAQYLVDNAETVKNGEPIPVPSTGFADIDRNIGGGFRPGRLIVIAGRPGMGKTVIEAASARRVARRGYGAGIFSLEIDGAEMSSRILADELAMMPRGTPEATYRDILTGELNDMQRSALAQASKRVQDLPIEIDATGGLSFFEIAARARIMIERWRQRGIQAGVIFIDYLGLITPSDRYRGRKVDELGEMAKAAKDLSKRLSVCVVLLAQLSRAVEQREDKRPNMADLRDSGNIEEHADVVGLLYRPYYYDQLDPRVRSGDPAAIERMEARKSELQLGLGKNRLGPTATVHLWCDVGRSAVDNARAY